MKAMQRTAEEKNAMRCALSAMRKLVEVGFDIATVVESFKTIIQLVEAPQESEK